MTARLLVTGSRTWENQESIYEALAFAWAELRQTYGEVLLVHGACPQGADALARRVWLAAGLSEEPHPANWSAYGKRAGFERNALMVDLGANLCLSFQMPCVDPKCRRPEVHMTHGTEHCTGLAAAAGIPIRPFR